MLPKLSKIFEPVSNNQVLHETAARTDRRVADYGITTSIQTSNSRASLLEFADDIQNTVNPSTNHLSPI